MASSTQAASSSSRTTPSKMRQNSAPFLKVLFQIVVIGVAFRTGILIERLQHEGACRQFVPSSFDSDLYTTDGHVQRKSSMSNATYKRLVTAINATKPRFTNGTSSFVHAIARTPKKEFMASFDEGVPNAHRENTGKSEVLLLYNSEKALPAQPNAAKLARYHQHGEDPPLLSVNDATANCDDVKIVMLGEDMENVRECVALVGHMEAHHVQRWMRLDGDKFNATKPFGPVTRDTMHRRYTGSVLSRYTTNSVATLWTFLMNYLIRIGDLKERLGALLKTIAIRKTVVVVTCNLGQSHLLANFRCHLRARGMDVTNVIVFPTDRETEKIAKGLKFATFYDEELFGDLPKDAAGVFGDQTFTKMMVSKLVPVHLVNLLGYNLLFQDVDIVWYKNPLTLFHNKTNPLSKFDMLMQDDGNALAIHGPYRGNAGFFYVKANKRTQYLLMSYLFALDRVTDLRSVQGLFNQMLPEHRSLTGLRVKTLHKFDFPSGHEFNREKDFMANFLSGKRLSWIFHMNWTKNTKEKIEFMKQAGMWHVQDVCIGDAGVELFDMVGKEKFMDSCCSAQPLVTCYYKNKPSIIDCKDSPAYK